MKYRVKVQYDDLYCFGCDCSLYILERRRKFLWLFPYYEEVDAYNENMKQEAYDRCNQLNNKL